MFSNEQLLFIQELRDQYSHSRLEEFNKRKRGYYKFENSKLIKEKLDSKEYWSLFRSIKPSMGFTYLESDLDNVLIELRNKFTSTPINFWKIDNHMRKINILNQLQMDIIHNENFEPSYYSIQNIIILGFKEKRSLKEIRFTNLAEYKSGAKFDACFA